MNKMEASQMEASPKLSHLAQVEENLRGLIDRIHDVWCSVNRMETQFERKDIAKKEELKVNERKKTTYRMEDIAFEISDSYLELHSIKSKLDRMTDEFIKHHDTK